MNLIPKREFFKKIFTGSKISRQLLYVVAPLFIITVAFYVIFGSMLSEEEGFRLNFIVLLVFININIILITVVILVITNNLRKLVADRRKNILGSKIRSKMIFFNLLVAIVPILTVVLISIFIVNKGIDNWLEDNVDLTINKSIELVGHHNNLVLKEISDSMNNSAHREELDDIWYYSSEDRDIILSNYTKEINADNVYIINLLSNKVAARSKQGASFFPIEAFNLSEQISKTDNIGYITGGYIINRNSLFNTLWVVHPIYSKGSNNVALGAILSIKFDDSKSLAALNDIKNFYTDFKQIQRANPLIKSSFSLLILFVGLVVLIVSISFSLSFANSIVSPLERLAKASTDVSKGDLSVKIDYDGNDEISFLIYSFNNMVARLKDSSLELSEKNETLGKLYARAVRDGKYIETFFDNIQSGILLYDSNMNIIKTSSMATKMLDNFGDGFEYMDNKIREFLETDEKDYFEQIEMVDMDGETSTLSIRFIRISDLLDDIDNIIIIIDDISDILNIQRINIWKELATRITHEIKNPLTPIKLTAELTIKRYKDIKIDSTNSENLLKSMKMIISEVETMQSMMDEFNSFTRLPALKREDFSLYALLLEIQELYGEGYGSFRINIVCPKDVVFYGDRNQLKRVFFNLINNSVDALKDREGLVNISVKQNNPETIVISYRDNGIGIAKDKLDKIFMPYFSEKADGTGLGLSIVERIIEMHDSSIKVHSKLGEYTEFIIELNNSKP